MVEDNEGIEEHLSTDELKERIDHAAEVHMIRRLLFIKFLYEELTIEDAAENIGISVETGERWASQWNTGGLDELVPDFRKSGWGTSSMTYSARRFRPSDDLPAADYPGQVVD